MVYLSNYSPPPWCFADKLKVSGNIQKFRWLNFLQTAYISKKENTSYKITILKSHIVQYYFQIHNHFYTRNYADSSLQCPVVIGASILKTGPVLWDPEHDKPLDLYGWPLLRLSSYPHPTCPLYLPRPLHRRATTLAEPLECARCCLASHVEPHYHIQSSVSGNPSITWRFC